MTTTLKIQPVDLVDLTVTTDQYAYTLADFTVSGGFLVGEIDATLSVSSVTISSSGYATQSFMYRNLPSEVVLVAQEVEILSDGTESYQISDKVARANITTIEEKIPAEASSSNQLTDKSYVDNMDIDLQIQIDALSSSLANVATSGSYNDLSDKPTIPTVNNATLTIQKNGTNVQTFTANASGNATANITVPTDTGDLTNNAGYITGINSSDVTTALGYTPANDSDVVKTSGNQNVNGIKKFTEKIVRKHSQQTAFSSISAQATAITKGTNPTVNTEARWYMTDSQGDFGNAYSIAGMVTGYDTNGTISAVLFAFKPESNSTVSSRLGIYYPTTGAPYTVAPTPAASDNSTKIATTAYVHKFFAAISGYDATKTQTLKNVNGTLTWVTD